MMTFTIHVAAAPEPQAQKCSRCSATLIDANGAMSLDGSRMRAYPTGGFVGSAPGCTILMDHDAREADEIRCDASYVTDPEFSR